MHLCNAQSHKGFFHRLVRHQPVCFSATKALHEPTAVEAGGWVYFIGLVWWKLPMKAADEHADVTKWISQYHYHWEKPEIEVPDTENMTGSFGTCFYFIQILGISSTHLTFIFFRRVGIPPTTNQSQYYPFKTIVNQYYPFIYIYIYICMKIQRERESV